MRGLILYTTEDGASRIQLRADGQTVWLTQSEMAELFDVTAENTRLHLENIFSGKELEPERTTEESSVVQREGGRDVRRPGRSTTSTPFSPWAIACAPRVALGTSR